VRYIFIFPFICSRRFFKPGWVSVVTRIVSVEKMLVRVVLLESGHTHSDNCIKLLWLHKFDWVDSKVESRKISLQYGFFFDLQTFEKLKRFHQHPSHNSTPPAQKWNCKRVSCVTLRGGSPVCYFELHLSRDKSDVQHQLLFGPLP